MVTTPGMRRARKAGRAARARTEAKKSAVPDPGDGVLASGGAPLKGFVDRYFGKEFLAGLFREAVDREAVRLLRGLTAGLGCVRASGGATCRARQDGAAPKCSVCEAEEFLKGLEGRAEAGGRAPR